MGFTLYEPRYLPIYMIAYAPMIAFCSTVNGFSSSLGGVFSLTSSQDALYTS